MINWTVKLSDAWAELLSAAPVARQYRTKLLSAEVSLDILVAVRAIDDAPCLILQTALAPENLFEVGGMRLHLVSDDAGPLLVLSLEDQSRRDLFLTICADVVATASSADNDARAQFFARLDAWRQFLRDRRSGLSRPETLGLIGELRVLDRLVCAGAQVLPAWKAPEDGLHDFQLDGHAVEVKSTLGPASSITISKLDQLDTAGLRRLDLLCVRMIESPNGSSLQEIINVIAERIHDERMRRAFQNALLRRGLMPDDNTALNELKTELRSIDAYNVSNSFPRLLRASLPSAIIDAAYTLDLRSLLPFSTDADSVINAFAKRDIHE